MSGAAPAARSAYFTGIDLTVRTPLSGTEGDFLLDLELRIPAGERLAITGPSGAGKTTLLRSIAGLCTPAYGRIAVGNEVWCDTDRHYARPVRERSIGFVFQDYALFPNMTTRGNVEYALAALPRARRHARATELLERVGLAALAARYPARLSGGQKQRLALIRALARRPRILMLDESLSALDAELRRRLQDELLALHHTFGFTLIVVSHDPAEISRLGERCVHIERGRIVAQSAAPQPSAPD